MTQLTQDARSAQDFNQKLVVGANKGVLWLSKHWLAVANIFFLIYVGLPVLAPILLAKGYAAPANIIYSLYRAACHQLPSRSFFIAGEQVAFCQRDVSIYASFVLGGILYGFIRSHLKPLPLRWYVFFLVPIAVDGGMQMASEILHRLGMGVMPVFWAIGLIAMGLVSLVLHRQKYLTWHSFLFFLAGPLSLLYLQYTGSHLSNWFLRTLTGFLFAIGTVWFAYPYLEESFNDIREEVEAKLAQAQMRN